METIRRIKRIIHGHPTTDGAGVKLTRIFGFYEEGMLDPFLLLDYFGSGNPDDFMAGFPWHPHRGIETVTYMLDGKVEHMDSMGNQGVISKGEIQWMTAGSGIIHQEMPKSDGTRMFGFQLWLNLPASHKMMPPRYQDIKASEIPEIILENQVRIKILAGEYNGKIGPVRDIIADPSYFDVIIPPNQKFSLDVNIDYTVFAFVFEGAGYFDNEKEKLIEKDSGALLDKGIKFVAETSDLPMHFILISGKPIGEPIAWRGPIVMNTEEELTTAFREYRMGTFVK